MRKTYVQVLGLETGQEDILWFVGDGEGGLDGEGGIGRGGVCVGGGGGTII